MNEKKSERKVDFSLLFLASFIFFCCCLLVCCLQHWCPLGRRLTSCILDTWSILWRVCYRFWCSLFELASHNKDTRWVLLFWILQQANIVCSCTRSKPLLYAWRRSLVGCSNSSLFVLRLYRVDCWDSGGRACMICLHRCWSRRLGSCREGRTPRAWWLIHFSVECESFSISRNSSIWRW